jgi:ATP-dependent protease ClpP protease subunit
MSSDSHILDHRISMAKDVMNDPIHCGHERHLDPQSNHIYLFGNEDLAGIEANEGGEPGVEYTMANRFIINLNVLMRTAVDKDKTPYPILIHMKTCGGDWTEGMAIYDAIKACPNPITILNYTHARSMSSLIFCAANKSVMMPHSYFLFHDGEYAESGTVKQVVSGVEWSKKLEKIMLGIYVERMKEQGKFSKWAKQRIYKMLRAEMDRKEDVYLTAEDTLKWGLADEIFGSDGEYDWSSLTDYTTEQLAR